MNKNNYLQHLFTDSLQTPALWFDDTLFNLQQLGFNDTKLFTIKNLELQQKRLGKYVETFICHYLKQLPDVIWIAENIQIKKDNITIGELDALFQHQNHMVHLEIVYKFYLYDTQNTFNDPLAYWIGPNRNDSLLYKLNKLKNKQLPLLYTPEVKTYLKSENLNTFQIMQKVCFKAQLFLPYHHQNIRVTPLHSGCISGFHLPFKHINLLSDFEFCIPKKLDWLLNVHADVIWLNFDMAKVGIEQFISQKRSPLCWIKAPSGSLQKCFITWWN